MTNQSRPLFSVNEVVIVCSKVCQDYNGEQVIESVTWKEAGVCRMTGKILDGHWGYVIYAQEDKSRWYLEESLRKKYPPSSQSFSELMNSLKSPEKV